MKNFISLLGVQYKPAKTSTCNVSANVPSEKDKVGRRTSMLDLFFNKRREGEGLRYPKSKNINNA